MDSTKFFVLGRYERRGEWSSDSSRKLTRTPQSHLCKGLSLVVLPIRAGFFHSLPNRRFVGCFQGRPGMPEPLNKGAEAMGENPGRATLTTPDATEENNGVQGFPGSPESSTV
jgi:hypothetical protein